MPGWTVHLNGDPLPWLLDEWTPAVRHLTLRELLDRPAADPEVVAAQAAAMAADPIAAILANQRPDGSWVKAGAGYGPKYRGTVWQVVFLEQLGADGADPRVRLACDHVLTWCPTESGGLGISSAVARRPPPSAVVHCLSGNLLRALIGLGWLEDARVQRAIDWQARSITGEGFGHYYRSGTSGPGFCCAVNEGLPCAWGAIKALRGLARIPAASRGPHVARAIEQGAAFLFSRDPAAADYPWPSRASGPNASWFKPGFPSGYVADVLQNMEVLCELGYGADSRLQHAIEWLLSKQGKDGCWKNEYAYIGKTWIDIEKQGERSKWVTLRACTVLKAAYEKGPGQ